MVCRVKIREYKKWLRQVLKNRERTKEEARKILDGQLMLPPGEMDGALIRECRLLLLDEAGDAHATGKQETMDKVRAALDKGDKPAKARARGPEGGRRRFFRRPVLLPVFVLLTVLLVGVSVNAVGFNVWRLIFHWSGDILDMQVSLTGHIRGSAYEGGMGKSHDDALYQKLSQLDMDPLLPSWLPEGFLLEQAEGEIDNKSLRWVRGLYRSSGRLYQVAVERNTANDSSFSFGFEKDDRKPDIYDRGGIRFYLVDNLEKAYAYWVDPPYMISVGGDVSREELMSIIDSIFERGT